ncbi:MAG: hypothetical protein ACO1NX_08955 [Chitinophagaceae bacterium]
MAQLKIVNYKSAKAYYKVESNNDLTFEATLEKYMGDGSHMPPRKVTYIKKPAFFSCNPPFAPTLLDDVNRLTCKR